MADSTTDTPSSPGRNEPCPCGSGKKYKKCCARKTQPARCPECRGLVLSLNTEAGERVVVEPVDLAGGTLTGGETYSPAQHIVHKYRCPGRILGPEGPGVIVWLNKKDDGTKVVRRVGRAANVRQELARFIGVYTSFQYKPTRNEHDAFVAECQEYHRYKAEGIDLDNQEHPTPPNGWTSGPCGVGTCLGRT